MKTPFKVGLLGLLATQAALAEPIPTYTAPDLVVTAARVPQPLGTALQDVTVISRQEIAAAGQETLAELLADRAGIEIAANGGPGQPESVFLRGANSDQTLVLVDGVRIGSASTGTAALEDIPLDQIDHIEILRGPASGLYGSQAIGGVIQIFTRAGQGRFRPNAQIGAGSYGTYDLSGGFSGQSGNASASFEVGHSSTQGFPAANPGAGPYVYNPDTSTDPYRNTNASARLAYAFGAHNEVGMTLFDSDGTAHFDSGPATVNVDDHKVQAVSLYDRTRILAGWDSTVRVGESVDDSLVTGAYPSRVRTDQPQATWQNDFTSRIGTVILGLQYLGQRLTSTTAYTQTSTDVHSAYGGYLAQFGRQGIQLNVRQDRNTQFGTHDSGSLEYGYQFLPSLRLTAGYGTAFKAPTFNDLYYPSMFGYSGNPNLRPERSHSAQIGLRYVAGSNRFRVVYFDNKIRDLISLNASGTTVINVDSARITGTEVSYRGRFAATRLDADVTVQDPRDETTGTLLPRRAQQFARIGASRSVAGWVMGAEVIGAGRRFDALSNAPGTRMGGYGLFNLTARYPTSRNTSWSIRWDNVFDKQYELAQGYNTPGSNVFVSWQYAPR
ncbi:MAG: TonB-dependent receptor [Betaproteobacteria bacterium]|nr:TonB-dependent receptor [Betaproteobacteria bacterium]